MLVKELMTREVLTCRESDTLERAAQLMWEGDVGAVAVVDEAGGAIGMITDRDVCMAAYTRGCGLSGCSVASAMSRQLQTCQPDADVARAEELMRQHRIRRLPVVQGGKLIGIVSLNDIALAASRRKPSKTGRVSYESVGATLASICEHRGPTAMAAQ